MTQLMTLFVVTYILIVKINDVLIQFIYKYLYRYTILLFSSKMLLTWFQYNDILRSRVPECLSR